LLKSMCMCVVRSSSASYSDYLKLTLEGVRLYSTACTSHNLLVLPTKRVCSIHNDACLYEEKYIVLLIRMPKQLESMTKACNDNNRESQDSQLNSKAKTKHTGPTNHWVNTIKTNNIVHSNPPHNRDTTHHTQTTAHRVMSLTPPSVASFTLKSICGAVRKHIFLGVLSCVLSQSIVSGSN